MTCCTGQGASSASAIPPPAQPPAQHPASTPGWATVNQSAHGGSSAEAPAQVASQLWPTLEDTFGNCCVACSLTLPSAVALAQHKGTESHQVIHASHAVLHSSYDLMCGIHILMSSAQSYTAACRRPCSAHGYRTPSGGIWHAVLCCHPLLPLLSTRAQSHIR